MGDPREKTPDHLQAELGLSHMWPELGANPQRWDDDLFRGLKISVLNHSVTRNACVRILRIFTVTLPTLVWIIREYSWVIPLLLLFKVRVILYQGTILFPGNQLLAFRAPTYWETREVIKWKKDAYMAVYTYCTTNKIQNTYLAKFNNNVVVRRGTICLSKTIVGPLSWVMED